MPEVARAGGFGAAGSDVDSSNPESRELLLDDPMSLKSQRDENASQHQDSERQTRTQSWEDLFVLFSSMDIPEDFPTRQDAPPQEHNFFD